jgi:hypothetical protein
MRNIDPGIWRDDWFGNLEIPARLYWIGILDHVADDQGRFMFNPRSILADLFLYDDQIKDTDLLAWTAAFIQAQKLLEYHVENRRYLQVLKWWKYQSRSAWMAPSKHPAPDGWIDRYRYHAQNNQIVSMNWDKPGGYNGHLPSALPSQLPSQLPTPQGRARVKGDDEGEGEEEGEGEGDPLPAIQTKPGDWQPEQETPSPAPAVPSNSSSVQRTGKVVQPVSNTGYTKFMEGAPYANPEAVYQSVTGLPTFPSNIRDNAIRILDAIIRSKNFSGVQAVEYFKPFFADYTSRTNANGQRYQPTGIGWLEWALVGKAPDRKKVGTVSTPDETKKLLEEIEARNAKAVPPPQETMDRLRALKKRK